MVEAEKKETPLSAAGFKEEIDEEVNIVGVSQKEAAEYYSTGYPKPLKRLRLVFESYNASIEETYFWVLNHIKQDQAYYHVHKITDTLTASENSSIFGVQVQRLNIQQDKAGQYMGTIANMVKNLFQIVREIRIIKERLAHYHGSLRGNKSSDIALKGYWVDLVEGGGKNPASIYGLASQLGFATLPDLFFDVMVKKGDDVNEMIEKRAGDFNRKVQEVLRRKLQQFVTWRDETQKELETRHKFTLRYLRQHWNTIRMYMSWVKPMLRNVARLQTNEKYRDSEELLTSMEGAVMEIEFLAQKNNIQGYYPVILAHFLYRVRPAMNFNNEYQRGPIHVGRVTVTLRAYAWSQKEIDKYLKLRNDEDFELLGMVDSSVQDAMEALGDELRKYLEEAEEDMGLLKKKEAPVEKPKGPGMLDPFMALFGGFKGAAAMFVSDKNVKKKPSGNRGPAGGAAKGSMWQTYKNYKKAHQMLSW